MYLARNVTVVPAAKRTMNHIFETTFSDGVYYHHCLVCGVYRVSITRKYSEPCGKAVDYNTCLHRGDVARIELCKACGGNVRIKIFACEIHGECTLRTMLPGVKCCEAPPCLDYNEHQKC